MILRLHLLILFLNLSACAFSQSSTPGGSVRLIVLSGSNLDFVFNSISDYKTGITYLNNTQIGISVTDEAGDNNPLIPDGIDDYTQWEISIEADDADGDGVLNGTNPANTLPFSVVEVQATSIAAGCGTCNLLGSPWVPLSVLPTIIIDGSNGGADQIEDLPSPENLNYTLDQINISFRCGFTTSLLGEIADYYADDMFIDLIMSP